MQICSCCWGPTASKSRTRRSSLLITTRMHKKYGDHRVILAVLQICLANAKTYLMCAHPHTQELTELQQYVEKTSPECIWVCVCASQRCAQVPHLTHTLCNSFAIDLFVSLSFDVPAAERTRRAICSGGVQSSRCRTPDVGGAGKLSSSC